MHGSGQARSPGGQHLGVTVLDHMVLGLVVSLNATVSLSHVPTLGFWFCVLSWQP